MANSDTIAAIATGHGAAGIGVIRISGARAHAIASALTGRKHFKPRYAHFCQFFDAQQECLDEGLCLYFPAPHSFTGEDVIELQGHGGQIILQLLLQRLVQLGVRLARAGEFSERAFLNDKLDLTQAEAVADLIEAGSAAAARAALKSLHGDFSRKVSAIVEKLIHQRVWVEAAFDFSDEEIDFHQSPELLLEINNIKEQLKKLLEQSRQSQKLREGLQIAIVGAPNAGKSSLFNALTGRDSAIVTSQAGTTRDLIRESLQLQGVHLELLDTAGLRHTEDMVEQEGIRRAQQQLQQVDLIIHLQAAHEPQAMASAEQFQHDWLSHSEAEYWRIYTQIDRLQDAQMVDYAEQFCISVKTAQGLDPLLARLQLFCQQGQNEDSQFLARERHIQALESASHAIAQAHQWLEQCTQIELVAEELQQAQQALGEITGRFSSDDLLGRIFSQFCIGK